MDINQLHNILENSLKEVGNKRFYETERGFQGELNGLISNKLKGISESDLISENEYQKKEANHGLNIRPDIIIHEPFNREIHKSRKDGNFLIIELKLRGSLNKVLGDFESIDFMIDKLEYRGGVFINIDSTENFSTYYEGRYRDKISFYAVKLSENNDVTIIKS